MEEAINRSEGSILPAHLPPWLLLNSELLPLRQADPVCFSIQPPTLLLSGLLSASWNPLCLTPTFHNLDALFMKQPDRKHIVDVTQQYSLG